MQKNGDGETLFAIDSRTMVERGRRLAVVHLCDAHGVSHATAPLSADCCAIACRVMDAIKRVSRERRRFGCRRIHVMIAREVFEVNHKKLRRIYRKEKLQVRRRGGRKRALGTRKA